MPRRTLAVLTGTAALVAVALPAAASPVLPDGMPPAARQDRLTVTVHEGTLSHRVHTLDCHPAGGSHPDAAEACAAIDRASRGTGNPWAPVPEGTFCTQNYGGPAGARITGTWRGQRVDAEFSRANGCEIARWDALVPALPAVGR